MPMSIAQPIDAWHFLKDDRKMQFGRRTLVVPGRTYRVRGNIVLCEHGLHASRRALDALRRAPGSIVCRVQMSGTIVEGDDELAASERTVLWMADATDTLRAFARWCALEVAHLWDMPPIVRQYLETGDESIRAAAQATTQFAVGAAAKAAAWAVAKDVAWTVAKDVAWAATWAVAGEAAWAVAGEAAWAAFNAKLETMLFELAPAAKGA